MKNYFNSAPSGFGCVWVLSEGVSETNLNLKHSYTVHCTEVALEYIWLIGCQGSQI